MRQSRTLIGVLLVLVSTAVGCASTGTGDLVSETREIGSFDRMEVSSGISVEVTVDPGAPIGLTSIYDDNLQDKIITEVRDHTLFIGVEGNVVVPGPGRAVKVEMPVLAALLADGGDSVKGVGTSEQPELRGEGGSTIDLEDLIVQTMNVGLDGGSKATVNALDDITGEVTGGATLTLVTDPDSRDLEVSGGGQVNG